MDDDRTREFVQYSSMSFIGSFDVK
jgi:hypothetical protein